MWTKRNPRSLPGFRSGHPSCYGHRCRMLEGGRFAQAGGENDGLVFGSAEKEAPIGLLDGDVRQGDWQILNGTARKRSGWKGRRE